MKTGDLVTVCRSSISPPRRVSYTVYEKKPNIGIIVKLENRYARVLWCDGTLERNLGCHLRVVDDPRVLGITL